MEAITGLTFTMDGETYVLHNGAADEAETGETAEDVAVSAEGWFYQGTEIDVTDLETAPGALSADSFTEETPTGKEEIRFTAYLSNANFPKVEVVLYRYDGEYCLATVDGRTVSFIPRSQAVALMEAVNAIVLK